MNTGCGGWAASLTTIMIDWLKWFWPTFKNITRHCFTERYYLEAVPTQGAPGCLVVVAAAAMAVAGLVCFEKYGFSGWVTRTSRPLIESSSASSFWLTISGYIGCRARFKRAAQAFVPA